MEVVFLRVLLRDFHVAGGHARLGSAETAIVIKFVTDNRPGRDRKFDSSLAATEIFEVPYCKEIYLQYSPRANSAPLGAHMVRA